MFGGLRGQLEHFRAKQRYQADNWNPANNKRLLDFYVRIMTKALDVERCSIFINDPANGTVWLQTAVDLGERAIEVPTKGSVVGEVISTGRPVIMTDMENRPGPHKETDKMSGFVTREILCVPIRSSDGKEVTGAIQALNKRGGTFTPEDEKQLEEMAFFLQLNIESIFLGQEAVSLTERLIDMLTRTVLVLGGGFVLLVVAVLFYLMALSKAPALIG